MNYEKVIRAEFNSFVNQTYGDYLEVCRFFKDHERLPLFIGNLVKNIKEAEHIILGSDRSPEEKTKVVKKLARDFAVMFCRAALTKKKEELYSGTTSFADMIMKP